MSYSDSEYEQYEECSFYALEENDFGLYDGSFVDNEPSYSIYTQFTFRDDDGYSYDHLYNNEYPNRGTTPPRKDLLKEIARWRETCKTLPQQYQAYSVMMKSSSEVPFEFFVNALFGYKPKKEDV